ncbi:MAG: enoyl-CoA hydratase/isomerase family protein [Flavobacteriales bacterium]|nr:enoyl-CoA hydratase/isomerase family protein [Flavobacteriales bacterium]
MDILEATKRKIKAVAVLGSGVMGSRLACHFANIGLKVFLLDIVPFDLSDEEKNNPKARNRIVESSLAAALKSNPSPVYNTNVAKRISTGNFDDNMHWIAQCDWILEAVVENLKIKNEVFEKVEKHRKPGTLITSNTSGIPISMMLQQRSEDFQAHFCGTHFFNPPRYLRLLEIIPSEKTHPEVTQFLMHYGDLFLGKKTVLCKDAPAFIANRIGVFSIMAIFHLMQQMDMTIEEVDAVTGPVSGRPKSATFRTSDLVGLDTLVKVATGVAQNCPNDEAKDLFNIPEFLQKLIENNWLGDKTGQGFYKKSKDANGTTVIEVLDLKTFEYKPQTKPRFESIGAARKADSVKHRIKILAKANDKASGFLKTLNQQVLAYSSNRIPEIADHLYQIDDAMRAGFGWELGPFETWETLGVRTVFDAMKSAGVTPNGWVEEMLDLGFENFYKTENGARYFYDIQTKNYQIIPGSEENIVLDNYRSNKLVWGNKGASLHDIGDGVLCLEFHTKMNAIGSEILQGINKSIDIAEQDGWRGLVIGNDAPNFSAGANLAMMLMLAIEQEYDELNMAIRYFQNTVMRLRYSAIPVVMAPHGMTLGGGCEMSLHADSTVAAAETYIGLVEFGAGLIPGGGGTKEFVVRASDSFYNGDPQLPTLQERFTTIATAKVATSGYEAFDIGVLHRDKDEVVINQQRLIAEAKRKVLELDAEGYVMKPQREDILVLGKTALGTLYAGIEAFGVSGFATPHDQKMARKLAFVMAGGDLSQPTHVSEQYLLDLEREAFLSLLGERKTLERIQHILKTGKPLRN